MEEEMRRALNQSVMEAITERLSSMEDLYFPRSIQDTAINPLQRKTILFDLLSRDSAVFLERYGSQLTSEELCEFDVLRDDYEVNWHLNHLRTLINPTSEEGVRSRSVTVKNRRRAYMEKLMSDGNYFSEDSMRDREPYLHHEYVGKFQDRSGRSMVRPGEKFSDTLMRRYEEAILVAKIRREQQRLGVPEKDWIGNEVDEEEEDMEEREEEEEDMEEKEDEEDEEEQEREEVPMNGKEDTHPSEVPADQEPTSDGRCSAMKISEGTTVSGVQVPDDQEPTSDSQCTDMKTSDGTTLSFIEMQEQMEQFTLIMQQKFLSGEDSQHLDYSKIDNDETLDDHWCREANYDAQEKYFDED